MEKNEKGRVSLPVRHDVILLKPRGTNWSVETPITAQLTHTLLFVPVSELLRKLSIFIHFFPHGRKSNGNYITCYYVLIDRRKLGGHFWSESPFLACGSL